MSNNVYNILRDFGGLFVSVLVLIIFAILLLTGNPGAEFFKEWVGIILTALLVTDRALKVSQGVSNGRYKE